MTGKVWIQLHSFSWESNRQEMTRHGVVGEQRRGHSGVPGQVPVCLLALTGFLS